jgi:hypothetical protein
MEFKKYMHVERFGTTEVEDIEYGLCHIFPKIDGTNGSIWIDNGIIKAGSRNRELVLDNDNQGFYDWVVRQENLLEFFLEFPEARLYGEWLVPHSLKTYRKDAWNRFYVFDVEYLDELIAYEQYTPMLDKYNIEYIPPLAIIKNPTYDNLIAKLPGNVYLIEDGKGAGEGIVIKNYEYRNKYDRQTWAKIVTSEFKEKNVREMGLKPTDGSLQIEEGIVRRYVTEALVNKVYENIKNETGWQSKDIPRLLNTVYYDLVREETWNFIKEWKFPKVDFKVLQRFTNQKIKEIKPELF